MNEQLLFVKQKPILKGQFQFFMHQFIDSCQRSGIPTLPHKFTPRHCHRLFLILLKIRSLFSFYRPTKKVIIACSSTTLLDSSYPYFLNYQIIPMLWDVWPDSHQQLFQLIKLMRCPYVLVTIRSMAQRIETELGIPALWVPEGIDTSKFNPGETLANRSIDVYELGRQHKQYHKVLHGMLSCGKLRSWKGNTYDTDGKLLNLAFANEEELLAAFPQTKIVVCFPKTDTEEYSLHGGLETLTQRYWEAMLSRCLIIGRAPKELTDLIGYDPVINVDWNAPEQQVSSILSHLDSYQELVDKNYLAAKKHASWDNRIQPITDFINTFHN